VQAANQESYSDPGRSRRQSGTSPSSSPGSGPAPRARIPDQPIPPASPAFARSSGSPGRCTNPGCSKGRRPGRDSDPPVLPAYCTDEARTPPPAEGPPAPHRTTLTQPEAVACLVEPAEIPKTRRYVEIPQDWRRTSPTQTSRGPSTCLCGRRPLAAIYAEGVAEVLDDPHATAPGHLVPLEELGRGDDPGRRRGLETRKTSQHSWSEPGRPREVLREEDAVCPTGRAPRPPPAQLTGRASIPTSGALAARLEAGVHPSASLPTGYPAHSHHPRDPGGAPCGSPDGHSSERPRRRELSRPDSSGRPGSSRARPTALPRLLPPLRTEKTLLTTRATGAPFGMRKPAPKGGMSYTTGGRHFGK